LNWKNRLFCSDIKDSQLNQSLTVMGWVDTIRDHGHVIFIHLRDRSGVLQIVFQPGNESIYSQAQNLRQEDVVSVTGVLKKRSEDTVNTHIATGNFELVVQELDVLNTSEVLPFMVSEKDLFEGEEEAPKIDEELRLRYRYLDLRRPSMQKNLFKRHEVIRYIREYLYQKQFIEVETPVLTKSTPEGARDYLVPSRVHEGKFYALPQSPQLFKQMLMMSGFERYFQIVKCFRDEDLRPNRQPEFTQLDLEASFIDETFVYDLMEPLVRDLFAKEGVHFSTPFRHISYAEAMSKYGSDRPDLRFGLELVEVTDIFKDTQYKIFRGILDNNGIIKGLNIKGRSEQLSKNVLQEEYAKKVIPQMGAKGMTWMRVQNGQLDSNIVQFFSASEQTALMQRMQAQEGDVLIFIADANPRLVHDVLGRFRLFLGQSLGFIQPNTWEVCWVTDFPLFELNEGHVGSMHHPFTQPQGEVKPLQNSHQLLDLKARAYDLVINGEEIGGGSIRIHNWNDQKQVFEWLGLSEKDIEEKFGFFVKALKFGTPPHGGIALGVDRLVSMLLGVESIREVIAFPKNRMAFCPLTEAPNEVASRQLKELHIQIESED